MTTLVHLLQCQNISYLSETIIGRNRIRLEVSLSMISYLDVLLPNSLHEWRMGGMRGRHLREPTCV